MAETFLIEVSYEVCNKVGGIYSLLKSKAPYITREYGRNYLAIGPYFHDKAVVEFDEQDPPERLVNTIEELVASGIKCHYGRWLIDGTPNAILVDHTGYFKELDYIKKSLWEFAKVDSLFADNWFNDPVVWSTAVGVLLDRMLTVNKEGKHIAHFHEWLAGGCLLKLRQMNSKIATVFTTHATVLGRKLAAVGEPVHRMMETGFDETKNLELARFHDELSKHTMEFACAKHADVFTTVSEITGREAEHFLGRKPDVLLPGGIDLNKYPSMEELTVQRRDNKAHIKNFLVPYFNRYYSMDFNNTRIMFISGRYEFHNKGIDVFIDALGRLNERMKNEKTPENVVVFIFIPSATRGEDFRVLKNKSLYEEMKEHVLQLIPEVEDEMVHSLTMGEVPKQFLNDEIRNELRKLAQHFIERRGETPPLCAFELAYPMEQDFIMQALWKNRLLNREEDKVKVIYYPSYLSPADRLISLDYNQAVMTCDVGVFPSYYEPWGYTPIEAAALGAIAITTDLAGFGKFIEGKGRGIYVLKREKKSGDETVEDLTSKLYEVVRMSKKELMECGMNAKELSSLADWSKFIKNYVEAYRLAELKLQPR
ncbi:MAG: glycosyltransferase [Candidatus Altiarchaeota archaeon]